MHQADREGLMTLLRITWERQANREADPRQLPLHDPRPRDTVLQLTPETRQDHLDTLNRTRTDPGTYPVWRFSAGGQRLTTLRKIREGQPDVYAVIGPDRELLATHEDQTTAQGIASDVMYEREDNAT